MATQRSFEDRQVDLIIKSFSGDSLAQHLADCKKIISNEAYSSLISLICLFLMNSINKVHLKSFINYVFTKNQNLKNALLKCLFTNRMENYEESFKKTIQEFIPLKKNILDIRCSPSYRLITKDSNKISSNSLINDDWYCIPHNATLESHTSFFVTTRKSQYLQAFYRLEDSMYEVDNILESYKTFVVSLELFVENCVNKPNEIINHSQQNDIICTSRTLPIICIKRLYNENYKKILDSYYKQPKKTAILLIKRLNDKINNWIELSYSYKLMWRKELLSASKNLAQFQFINSKHIDFRYLHPKIIINNIVESDPPVFEFVVERKNIIEDILNLTCRHLRRQPIAKESKSTMKYILYHFVPEILGIYEGTMSDDDYDILSKENEYADLIEHLGSIYSVPNSNNAISKRNQFRHHASFSNLYRKSPKNIRVLIDDNWLVLMNIMCVLYNKLLFAADFLSQSSNISLSRQAMILTGSKFGKTYKNKIENGTKEMLINDIFIEYVCDFMDGNYSEEEYFEKVFDIFSDSTHKIANVDKLIKSCYKQFNIILDSKHSIELMKYNYRIRKMTDSIIDNIANEWMDYWIKTNNDDVKCKFNLFLVSRDSNFASSKKFIFTLEHRYEDESSLSHQNIHSGFDMSTKRTIKNSLRTLGEVETNPILSPPSETTQNVKSELSNMHQDSFSKSLWNDSINYSFQSSSFDFFSEPPFLKRNLLPNNDINDPKFTVFEDSIEFRPKYSQNRHKSRKNHYIPNKSFLLIKHNYSNRSIKKKLPKNTETDSKQERITLDEILNRII